eukprot:COSAG01_NODE_5343_length_4322_cov_122.044281_1_plen_698_part_00
MTEPKCPAGHLLKPDSADNGWACDGRHLPNGCVRGCTGFRQSSGWGRFRCAACDFDLCDLCVVANQQPTAAFFTFIDTDGDRIRIDLDPSSHTSTSTPGDLIRTKNDDEDERATWVSFDSRTGVYKNSAGVGTVPEERRTGLAAWLASVEALVEALRDAAYKGDLATVNLLLATALGRAAIDVKDYYGRTALMRAADRGHTPVVEALLGAGADATMKVGLWCTALVMAAENGRTPTVLALLRARPGEALARADREKALRAAGPFGHAAVAYFLSQSLGRPFGPEQLAEIQQNVLTYDDDSTFTENIPLGGEQGTILVAVLVALISCCALPQGRGWVRRRIPLADSPTHGRAGTTNAVSLRGPGHRGRVRPRRAGPAGGEVRPASGRAPVLVLLLAQPGQPALHLHGLDPGHRQGLGPRLVRALERQRRARRRRETALAVSALARPRHHRHVRRGRRDGAVREHGGGGHGGSAAPGRPPERGRLAQHGAPRADGRRAGGAREGVLQSSLLGCGWSAVLFVPYRIASACRAERGVLRAGFAQMQEMRFVLENFADLCDIMPSDAVQEGDAGRNDPAATWTYMAGRLRKMGGGKTGRNKSYKERTFELGKNELRYKAGATKGNSWQTIDLSRGTVMVGKGYKPGTCTSLDKSKEDAITLVDAQGRTWELRAPSKVQANNWGVAIETRTGCKAVGKFGGTW